MTTIVNTPPTSDSGNGFGFLIGMLVFAGIVIAIIFFGIPAIRNMQPVQINVETPEINVPAPQINVEAPANEQPSE